MKYPTFLAAFTILLVHQLTPLASANSSAAGVRIETLTSEWVILVTAFGYSDLLLDKRPGFLGREYLSGEWAAAIHYDGGSEPEEAIWFQDVFAFPCWKTNSNFRVVQGVTVDESVPNDGSVPGLPPAPGFPPGLPPENIISKAHSIIENDDVRITIRYEIIDSGEGMGLAQGDEETSAGGEGRFTQSTRHFLKQTYEVENISGGALTNIKLYQFLHGLYSTVALQDNRPYSHENCVMPEYRYDNTQRATTRSTDGNTGEIIQHVDIMTMHAKRDPHSFEVGRYGIDGIDDHAGGNPTDDSGKPSVGVHLSVEANSLNPVPDIFGVADPPLWVSGAMCFNLPSDAVTSLPDGETAVIDVLLSLSTNSTLRAPAPDYTFNQFGFDNGDVLGCPPLTPGMERLVIDFNVTDQQEYQTFRFYVTDDLRNSFPNEWTQPAAAIVNINPGVGDPFVRYCLELDPNVLRRFIRIAGVVNPIIPPDPN